MKKNRTKIISKSLYAVSAVLLLYGLWSFISTNAQVSKLIAAGKLSWKGSEYDIVNFVVSNSINYFIFAIVLTFMGWYLVKSETKQQGMAVSEMIVDMNSTHEIPKMQNPETPLSLLDGSIKTYLKDEFEYGNKDYAEIFFESPEKIKIQEAYDAADGDSEIVLVDVTDTWNSLEKAFKNVCAYYNYKLNKKDLPYSDDDVLISKQQSFGQASGFYVCEKSDETELYLFLDIDDYIYLIRYNSYQKVEDIIKMVEKIKVNHR